MSIIDALAENNFRTGHGGSGLAAGEALEVSDDSPEVITVTAPSGIGELTLEARGTGGTGGTASALTHQRFAGEDLGQSCLYLHRQRWYGDWFQS